MSIFTRFTSLLLFVSIGLLILSYFFSFGNDITNSTIQLFLTVLTAILLILCGLGALFDTRLNYIRLKNRHEIEWRTYKLRLTDDFEKTAAAMERVLEGLALNSGEANEYTLYYQGLTRPHYTFEIVSIEGTISFYIRVPARVDAYFKSTFYSFYSDIELIEVNEDYVDNVSLENDWSIWGAEFKTNKSPTYSLRTYTEFEKTAQSLGVRDKSRKFVLQSLAPLLEAMSRIGVNEQIWLQLVFRSYKDKAMLDPKHFLKAYSFKDDYKKQLEELKPKKDPDLTSEKQPEVVDKTIIDKMNEKLHKQKFEVGIRGIYAAKGTSFQPVRITALISSFKHFQTEKTNKIIPTGELITDFDYPWQPLTEKFGLVKKGETRRQVLERYYDNYRRRDFFYYPNKYDVSVLSAEELASLFYPLNTVSFDNQGISKDTFTKLDAPSNIPTI